MLTCRNFLSFQSSSLFIHSTRKNRISKEKSKYPPHADKSPFCFAPVVFVVHSQHQKKTELEKKIVSFLLMLTCRHFVSLQSPSLFISLEKTELEKKIVSFLLMLTCRHFVTLQSSSLFIHSTGKKIIRKRKIPTVLHVLTCRHLFSIQSPSLFIHGIVRAIPSFLK